MALQPQPPAPAPPRSSASLLDRPFTQKERLLFLGYMLILPYLFWFPLFYLASMIRTYPERPDFYGLWLSPKVLTVAYAACGLLLIDRPRILRERMQKSGLHGEKPGEPPKEIWAQRILLILSLAEIVVSCYDAAGRAGTADERKAISIVGSMLLVVSFILVSWVCRVNSYGSKVVYKQEGQQLITSGPYKMVRHVAAHCRSPSSSPLENRQQNPTSRRALPTRATNDHRACKALPVFEHDSFLNDVTVEVALSK